MREAKERVSNESGAPVFILKWPNEEQRGEHEDRKETDLKKLTTMKRLTLLTLAICQFVSLFSQEEWEDMDISSWRWSINENLTCYGDNNRASRLEVINFVAETDKNKRDNRWSSYTAWMNCKSIGNRACEITFSAQNDRSPEMTHPTYKPDGTMVTHNRGEDLYWGVTIQAPSQYGGTSEYTINYGNHYDTYYKSFSIISNNSDDETWKEIRNRDAIKFTIIYDGTSINIYADGNKQKKTLYNVNGISRIGIKVGTASDIVVKDFHVLRQTDYGMAKDEINKAIQALNNHEYSDVISLTSRTLNNYKAALPYYLRGEAFRLKELYKAAIDDYTSALCYSCDTDLRHRIYLGRAIARAQTNDIDNTVSDLRNAGEEGRALLKEFGFEDYLSGQRKSSSGTPKLRKDGNTSSGSSQRTPILQKTK